MPKPLQGLINKLRAEPDENGKLPRLPEYVWKELGPGHNYLREAIADEIEARVEQELVARQKSFKDEDVVDLDRKLKGALGVTHEEDEDEHVVKELSPEQIGALEQAQKVREEALRRLDIYGDEVDQPHTRLHDAREDVSHVQHEVEEIRHDNQRQEQEFWRKLVKRSIRTIKKMAQEAEAAAKAVAEGESASPEAAALPSSPKKYDVRSSREAIVSGLSDPNLANFCTSPRAAYKTNVVEDPAKALSTFIIMVNSGTAPWLKAHEMEDAQRFAQLKPARPEDLARWREYVRPDYEQPKPRPISVTPRISFPTPAVLRVSEPAKIMPHEMKPPKKGGNFSLDNLSHAAFSHVERYEELNDELLNAALKQKRSR